MDQQALNGSGAHEEDERLGPVLVIGTGLIGASVGLALSGQGVQVHLRDLDPANAMVAAGLGAGVLEPPTSCRLVIVATPPGTVSQTVRHALAEFPEAVVTDTASVKEAVIEDLLAQPGGCGPELARYVGSHPMAGTQYTGPLTAAGELFVDRTWVLTPRPDNDPEAVERVERMVRVCGARPVVLDAAEHDAAVAEVSHLPHLMSVLTGASLRRSTPTHLRLAGTGVRDVTRVARSQTAMWREILVANRQAVRTRLEAIRDDLDVLLASLDDPEELESFLAVGQEGARSVAGKHGRVMGETVAVVVEIPDAPGALARLFSDMEGVGVNIEDLSVEHDPSREVGFLAIDVDPARAEELKGWMRERGWGLRS